MLLVVVVNEFGNARGRWVVVLVAFGRVVVLLMTVIVLVLGLVS